MQTIGRLLPCMLAAGAAIAAPASPDWLELSPVKPGAEAAEAWTRIMREQARHWPVGTRRATGAVPDSFTSATSHRIHSDGEYAGMWWFFGNEGEKAPASAVRLVMPVAPPYRVRAELYCDETADDHNDQPPATQP